MPRDHDHYKKIRQGQGLKTGGRGGQGRVEAEEKWVGLFRWKAHGSHLCQDNKWAETLSQRGNTMDILGKNWPGKITGKEAILSDMEEMRDGCQEAEERLCRKYYIECPMANALFWINEPFLF